MKLYETILAATEFSSTSDSAFEEAIRLAATTGAELKVIHVYDPPLSLAVPYGSPELYQSAESATRKSAVEHLERLAERARARGVEVKWILDDGFVADEIVESARREKASLIVMGTHGRRGVARVVLGSVAARVVATAPCPVLTVRPGSPQLDAPRKSASATANV
jgi:nucleotide-binding universal stress UspA family protein